jgi:hypothetical protein
MVGPLPDNLLRPAERFGGVPVIKKPARRAIFEFDVLGVPDQVAQEILEVPLLLAPALEALLFRIRLRASS